MASVHPETGKFHLQETTIAEIHAAFAAGELSARRLVELYLNRIEAYDRNGPKINSIITVNPHALEDAEKLDHAWERTGVVGPLHGIPVILKDQMDARGMPTTVGSVVFKDHYPDRDSFVTEKLNRPDLSFWARLPSENWDAETPMGRCLAPQGTHLT